VKGPNWRGRSSASMGKATDPTRFGRSHITPLDARRDRPAQHHPEALASDPLLRRRHGCYAHTVQLTFARRCRRPWPRWAVALVAFCALVAATHPARAETIALLPTSGRADVESRARLDADLRRAFTAARETLTLQPARDTAEAFSTFIALNGERCADDDGPCWSKLGIIADVDTVVVLEASRQKGSLAVTCVVVDVAAGMVTQTIARDVVLGDTTSVEALVSRVLTPPSVPRLLDAAALPRTTEPSTSTRPPTVPRGPGPVDETTLTSLQLAGVIVGGSGGALAVLGALGALSCEAIFWTGTGTKELRGDVVAPLGAALWVGALVGVVAGGAGLGLWVAGSPVDEPRLQ
jgi:hypothetical protein